MLGVPALVTAYASAGEQIEDGIDGRIFANDDEAFYRGLKETLADKTALASMREAATKKDYGSEREMTKFYESARRLGILEENDGSGDR
jgi:hypothetical protein